MSRSLWLLTLWKRSCRPKVRPASCRSLNRASTSEMSGLLRTAINATCGTNSWISSSRFAFTVPASRLTPDTLPPGRFKLATRPVLIGSTPFRKTMGIVVVAALAASAAASPAKAAMTFTLTTHQIGRQRWKALKLTFRPAVVDHNILAFDIAGVLQTLAESAQTIRETVREFGIAEIRRPAAQAAARAPGAATKPPRRRAA